MVKVLFENVGGKNLTWECELEELTERRLAAELRRKNALMSRGVDFDYDEVTNEGLVIVGGFRPVGTFKVIK